MENKDRTSIDGNTHTQIALLTTAKALISVDFQLVLTCKLVLTLNLCWLYFEIVFKVGIFLRVLKWYHIMKKSVLSQKHTNKSIN